MDPDDFKNLALIPALLKQVEEMSAIMKKMMPPITTKKDVAKFLEKSEGTIGNYISNGLLKEGKHLSTCQKSTHVYFSDSKTFVLSG